MIASPQYIENIVATFDRAAEVNRCVRGRQGSTVFLTPQLADDVLVTGDIHGHRRNFDRLGQIAALAEHPHRHLVFQEVCHGGACYPNGGCMSYAILEDAAALVAEFPGQVHLILGNHELAEMCDYPIRKNNQLLNLLFRLGLRYIYGEAEQSIREAMMRFLWSCPVAVRLSQGVLIAHSLPESVDFYGFEPSVLLRDLVADDGREGHDIFRLVWGRDYRRQNAQSFCDIVGVRLLITGHEPCREGFASPNDLQVILDCCSDKAAYAILPVGVELTHADVLQRIRVLED
jgi:hypothetical protein